jgi:hypothetical protein
VCARGAVATADEGPEPEAEPEASAVAEAREHADAGADDRLGDGNDGRADTVATADEGARPVTGREGRREVA